MSNMSNNFGGNHPYNNYQDNQQQPPMFPQVPQQQPLPPSLGQQQYNPNLYNQGYNDRNPNQQQVFGAPYYPPQTPTAPQQSPAAYSSYSQPMQNSNIPPPPPPQQSPPYFTPPPTPQHAPSLPNTVYHQPHSYNQQIPPQRPPVSSNYMQPHYQPQQQYPPYTSMQHTPHNHIPPTQTYGSQSTQSSYYQPYGNHSSYNQMYNGFDKAQASRNASAVFHAFDANGNGDLDLHEFMEALRKLELAISYHEALTIFQSVDKNFDGRISETEFIDLYVEEARKRSGYR